MTGMALRDRSKVKMRFLISLIILSLTLASAHAQKPTNVSDGDIEFLRNVMAELKSAVPGITEEEIMLLMFDQLPEEARAGDGLGPLLPLVRAKVDIDENGTATLEEIRRVFAAAAQTLATIKPAADLGCGIPAVEVGAEVVLVGAYEAWRYASVSLGEPGQKTGFADIKVEAGDALLYVVLTSHDPLIWNFSGNIARISKVVVSNSSSGGVFGVHADKVQFVKEWGCIPRVYDFTSAEGIYSKEQVDQFFGFDVKVGGTYYLDTVTIPAMQVDESASNSQLDRTTVTVDPAGVVAERKVSAL